MSQPQPQGRLLPRGSAGDELHRPPMAPEKNAQDLTSNTQAYEPTDFEVQRRLSSSAADEDDMLSRPQGSQTQLYPLKPQKDDMSQSPYSYKYPMRYKSIGTGRYNIPGALPSSGHMIPGNIATLEDRYRHVFEEFEANSATRPPKFKALPTVHDHVTDQLDAEGKEYIPREIDLSGETKVSKDGRPLGWRVFRCRTFRLPDRGETFFMLGADCARVLGYRDSDDLFDENRTLVQIIATITEKENLVQQNIIPKLAVWQQIAVVTARSMFRQFGARIIQNGRRVQDDYWEAKAREQGFTPEDAASETTPGAAKARGSMSAQARTKGRRQDFWKTFKF